jgi:hypothetical protein
MRFLLATVVIVLGLMSEAQARHWAILWETPAGSRAILTRISGRLLAHLRPQEEMRRRGLKNVEHVHNLHRIARALQSLLSLAKQRAPILCPFWPSHGIRQPEKRDISVRS